MTHRSVLSFAGFGLSIALGLSACAPERITVGYIPNDKAVAAITPGKDTRQSVLNALGTPSATATFDRDSWYYISRTTEGAPYQVPKMLDQQVVAIDFDARGAVSEVRRFSMADAQNIQPVGRETPTRGTEVSVIRQFFGNIGRFNGAPVGQAPGP